MIDMTVSKRLLKVTAAKVTDNHRDIVCFMTLAGTYTDHLAHLRPCLGRVMSQSAPLLYWRLSAPAAFTATMFSVVKWRLVLALARGD